MNTTTRRALGALAIASLGLAACGDDDTADPATTNAAATTTSAAGSATTAATETTAATGASTHETTHDDAATVVIDGVNYAFAGVPDSVAAGTHLAFHNSSTDEFHEMVVIRIPDSETRPVSELVTLPEDEINAIFGDAPPAAVFVAPPGEDGMAVVGDGTIAEPGRYALVCFIPVGADPAAVAEAMQTQSSGPPDLGDGPPHVAQGMYAELNVTG